MKKNKGFGLLGYLLLTPDRRYLCAHPDIPYFGIDREHLLIASEISKTDPKKAAVIDELDDETDESSYISSFERALALQEKFLSVGETLEIIRCEVWLDGLIEPRPLILLPQQLPPLKYIYYGFDVGWPVSSYHSAIHQPYFFKKEPSWLKKTQ